LISQTNDFVSNIPTVDLLWETDYCGGVGKRSRQV